MEKLLELIPDSWEKYLVLAGAAWAFLTALAAVTPSNKDNTFLGKVGGLADKFGLDIKGLFKKKK